MMTRYLRALFSRSEHAVGSRVWVQLTWVAPSGGMWGMHGADLGNYGDILATQGRWAEAESALSSAIEVLDTVGDALVAGIFRGSLALLVARKGDLDHARRLAESAAEQTRGKHIFEYVKALCKGAQVESFGGDQARGFATLAAASKLIDEMGVEPESQLYAIRDESRERLEKASTNAPG